MALDTDFANITQLTQNVSQTSTPSAGSCNMCKKKGLPILPVRYGVVADTNAHKAAGALPVGGTFGAGVTGTSLKRAKYALRTLRYGFVYVFYPATKRWQAYAVTAEGNLYDYPLDIPIDRSFEKPFSCHQPGHAQLAQCITIDNAQSAGTVYLAFSDELWTKAVRDLYASNFMGCRDKRMQKLDAAGAYNGNTSQPHSASVNQVESLLNEYGSGKHPDAMLTGCFPYHDRAGQSAALKKAMDTIQPSKGMVFALWDAVGITQELNFEQRVAFGAALDKYEHGIWTASAIDALHKAVTASAKEDIERSTSMLEGNTYESLGLASLFDGGKMLDKQIKSLEDEKEKELASADVDSWKPYSTHYRQQEITNFQQAMADAMKQEQATTLAPLSQDHAAWLTSDALLNVFEHDYEQDNWRSALHYTQTFTSCIEGSADRKEAVDALVKWAGGSVLDTRNPLLRSFVLNSPVLADKVKEASSYPYAELREFVAKLIESFSKITDVQESKDKGIKAQVAQALAKLLHEAGGPLVQTISTGVDTAAVKVIYATLCMRTKVLFEYKAVYGTANQWVNYVAAQIQEMMPGAQQAQVQNLQEQLQTKAAAGSSDPEVKVKQFVLVESPATEAAHLANVSSQPGFEKMASVTLTPDVVKNVYLPKFRLVTKGEPGFTGIGAIFSLINLHFAHAELEKSNRFNAGENNIKWKNAIGGAASGVATYGAAAFEALEEGGVKVGAGWLRFAKFLNIAGRYGGAAVGAVSAAIDLYHAYNDFKEGNMIMMALDLASATVGVALAYSVVFMTASAAAVIALPLLLVAAVIGVLMNYFKGREVYEWLERCYFGLKKGAESFQTLDEDRKAFLAMLS